MAKRMIYTELNSAYMLVLFCLCDIVKGILNTLQMWSDLLEQTFRSCSFLQSIFALY